MANDDGYTYKTYGPVAPIGSPDWRKLKQMEKALGSKTRIVKQLMVAAVKSNQTKELMMPKEDEAQGEIVNPQPGSQKSGPPNEPKVEKKDEPKPTGPGMPGDPRPFRSDPRP